MLIRELRQSVKLLKELRSRGNYGEADELKQSLISRGVHLEIERDGSIFWWYQRESGAALNQPADTDDKKDALDHLLHRTYKFRNPLFLGKMTIPPDLSYRDKSQLINILVAKKP